MSVARLMLYTESDKSEVPVGIDIAVSNAGRLFLDGWLEQLMLLNEFEQLQGCQHVSQVKDLMKLSRMYDNRFDLYPAIGLVKTHFKDVHQYIVCRCQQPAWSLLNCTKLPNVESLTALRLSERLQPDHRIENDNEIVAAVAVSTVQSCVTCMWVDQSCHVSTITCLACSDLFLSTKSESGLPSQPHLFYR
ncbi:hypothetical protein J6590_052422 [Homalodisca vitripennis]|nr:hypothetical protein J6590_052422 [Homalodisca vitripennis]